MRPHFTYELQEDRIRKTFRDFSKPLTEEAWQKFSVFSESQPKPQSGKFSGFDFRINRRVALTAAASLVVLLLALLIFNFAGSSDSGNETQKAASAEPFVPMPQFDEPEIVNPPPAPSEEKPVIAATGDKEATPAKKPEVVKEKKPSVALQPTTTADTSASLAQAKPTRTAPAKKKVRNDSSDDLLQTVQLPDIRPSLLPSEPEEDILAN